MSIDILKNETVEGCIPLEESLADLRDRRAQAREHIRHQANRVGMPFVAERWLGGTLTNFRTVRSRLARLEELEAAEADGTALQYSKKMMATRTRELRKIKRNLEGIRGMARLPGALIVVDVHRERNAVREAKRMGIPTVCLIDTDSDPDYADVPIPGNDDAMRAIETILAHLADAVEVGLRARRAPEPDQESRAPRRRSIRPATARAGESEPPPPVAEPPGTDAAATAPGTEPPAGGTEPPAPPESKQNQDAGLTPATATEPEVSP